LVNCSDITLELLEDRDEGDQYQDTTEILLNVALNICYIEVPFKAGVTVYIYRHTTEKEQTGTWMWYLGSRFSKLQQLINKVKANSEKNIHIFYFLNFSNKICVYYHTFVFFAIERKG
jgi:hypothetical protein